MAKQGSKGEYICGHCGATSMDIKDIIKRGSGAGQYDQLILICNKCGQQDVYDSVPK
jgi:5-methylcytosine-specific restriction endonuclease McrA